MAIKCPKCQVENPAGAVYCAKCATKLEAAGMGEGFSFTRTFAGPEDRYQPGGMIGGRYKLQTIAGRGGMGVVFKAEDTRLRRTVALKFLPEEFSRAPEAKERFLREAQAAAILDHPNICPIYEVDEADGATFFTMAFVDGLSLKDKIAAGPVPLLEVIDLALQIAEGLKAAHEKGVVHRDIKPANIMLGREGQARITDFGLASLEGGAALTRPQTVLGTAAYMSPEQVRGEKADGRTDIWAFGCTLYEMTTGRRPFPGEHGQAVLYEILNETSPPPSALRVDVLPGLEKVILKCLQKKPADRYPDMESVIDALKGVSVRRPAAEGEPAAPKEVLPSLAVLPFADMSSAKDQDYFAEGLAEELIHALARIRGIRVVARTSAFALKGLKLDVREIGKRLDVRAVLEGSVRKAGHRLRITAQLIDARTGLHIWSERFDREEADVFDIQDEISLAIVEHLKVSLLAGEKTALRRRSTDDPEAYNLYLKGLYFVARPNPEAIGKALNFFHEAIGRDPNFALAHTGVATVFSTLGIMNLAPPAEMYPKAKAALEKSLSLDPDLAEAHAVAASLQFWFEWNWTAAEKSFGRVLALNPGDAMSRGQYAWLLMNRKRFDESVQEIKRALAIDPLMPLFYAWSIGLHNTAGRYDEALGEFTKMGQIDPNFGLAYFHAGMAYYLKGLYDESIKTLEKGRELVVFPGWIEGMLLFCHLKKGDRKKAEEILAAELEDRKRSPVSPVCLAWDFAALGNLDSAIQWLETAIQERDTLMAFIHVYTEMVNPVLARDPRFDTILKKMNLTK
ncbi:MAG: protein kinase [Candidatus Aminicenantales bacterium]